MSRIRNVSKPSTARFGIGFRFEFLSEGAHRHERQDAFKVFVEKEVDEVVNNRTSRPFHLPEEILASDISDLNWSMTDEVIGAPPRDPQQAAQQKQRFRGIMSRVIERRLAHINQDLRERQAGYEIVLGDTQSFCCHYDSDEGKKGWRRNAVAALKIRRDDGSSENWTCFVPANKYVASLPKAKLPTPKEAVELQALPYLLFVDAFFPFDDQSPEA